MKLKEGEPKVTAVRPEGAEAHSLGRLDFINPYTQSANFI